MTVSPLDVRTPTRRPHGRYTYLATDILTGTVTAEVPMVGVSYGFELGWGCKQFRGTVPLFDRTLFPTDSARRDVLLATRKWRSGLYVLRDGVVQWGGIITSVLPDGQDSLSVTAQGALAYFNRRLISDDLLYGSGAASSDAGVTWTEPASLATTSISPNRER